MKGCRTCVVLYREHRLSAFVVITYFEKALFVYRREQGHFFRSKA